MVKGHLDQSHQNQYSTKMATTIPEPNMPDNDTQDEYWPLSDENNKTTHQCFAACTEDTTIGKSSWIKQANS